MGSFTVLALVENSLIQRLTCHRQPPPAESRPEAPNFPTTQYSMSHDSGLFQAPRSSSEPPALAKPKPLFPWEANAPKPTRVFAEDLVSPDPEPAPESATATTATEGSFSTSGTPETSVANPSMDAPARADFEPPLFQPSGEPFTAFKRTNAWDEVPEIDHYVRALQKDRRGPPPQIVPLSTAALSPTSAPSTAPTSTSFVPADAAPAVADPDAPAAADDAKPRRPSMKLTDFPTEIERPSLPVTPAPVRRASYWDSATGAADDDDEAGAGPGSARLPGADGVPPPQDWDPLAKLEELRRAQDAVLRREPAAAEALPERAVVRSSEGMLSPRSEAKTSLAVGATEREEGNGAPVSASAVSE